MALLVLWPAALLFPAPICLGLGQVGANLRADLVQWLQASPLGTWTTFQHPPTAALSHEISFALVLLGLTLPCLTGFAVIRGLGQRVLFTALALLVGVGVSALSAVLTYGPGHAWVWLDAAQAWALLAGWLAAVLLAPLPRWAHGVLLGLGLSAYLLVINQVPESTYVVLNLQQWEQGRFIRFNGLAQWLGWIWPYAVWVWALVLLLRMPMQHRLH
jgi:hypothetical protein